MKANQLKPSRALADVILGSAKPLVVNAPRVSYVYKDGERTDEMQGFTCDLVLANQGFEKVRCLTRVRPSIGLNITQAIQVELVNPIAEVNYFNELKIIADDIVESTDKEV